MDLSEFHNPYDFANPVADEDLFVGRKDEMEEIKYYLDHAKTAPRPINIALLGQRASGKTSMLNMTEVEAKRRDFCTIRIDLDEGDVKTQLSFFYKLFDGIFTQACECGAYGGKEGKTYDTYLDIVNTYAIPKDSEEKLFCPFIFPIQYAKAMGSGNINAQLSDHNYKTDLTKLQSEVNRPIVLLLAEGNVLAISKINLEKLRNIFMNVSGFMLVITGTPDILPVMDDVFSPIVRQFKKITLSGFKTKSETEDCISKPLKKIGITPHEVIDLQTSVVKEIHDLSGGRPYEIQLICHILFKRLQLKKARKMTLHISVLEDVRRELETSQDITARPVLTKLRHIKKNQLSALKLLCACNGRATFEDIWKVEYIINRENVWTKEALNRELGDLTKEEIITIDRGLLKFNGDDFDKVYTKYFAREKGVSLSFPDFPLEVFLDVRMRAQIQKIEGIEAIDKLFLNLDTDLSTVFEEISSRIKGASDILDPHVGILEDLFPIMLHYRDLESVPFIFLRISSSLLNAQMCYYAAHPIATKQIGECLRKIEELKNNIREVGGDLVFDTKNLTVIPPEILCKYIMSSSNDRLKNNVTGLLEGEMFNEYMNRKSIKGALCNADLLYNYFENKGPGLCNNIGYVFMNSERLDEAAQLFEMAIIDYKDEKDRALPNYNLGIVNAKRKYYKEALFKIELSIQQLIESGSKKVICSCLVVPKLINGRLLFEEVREEPDLIVVTLEAKTSLALLLREQEG